MSGRGTFGAVAPGESVAFEFDNTQKFSLDISGIEEAGETIDFSADIRKDIADKLGEESFALSDTEDNEAAPSEPQVSNAFGLEQQHANLFSQEGQYIRRYDAGARHEPADDKETARAWSHSSAVDAAPARPRTPLSPLAEHPDEQTRTPSRPRSVINFSKIDLTDISVGDLQGELADVAADAKRFCTKIMASMGRGEAHAEAIADLLTVAQSIAKTVDRVAGKCTGIVSTKEVQLLISQHMQQVSALHAQEMQSLASQHMQQVSALHSQVSALESEKADLASCLESCRGELDACHAQIQDLEKYSERGHLQHLNRGLNKEKDEALQRVGVLENELRGLQAELDKAHAGYHDEMQAMHEDNDRKLESTRQHHLKLQDDAVRAERERLQAEFSRTEEELRREVQNALKAADDLRGDYEALSRDHADLSRALEDERARVAMCQQDLAEKNEELTRMREQAKAEAAVEMDLVKTKCRELVDMQRDDMFKWFDTKLKETGSKYEAWARHQRNELKQQYEAKIQEERNRMIERTRGYKLQCEEYIKKLRAKKALPKDAPPLPPVPGIEGESGESKKLDYQTPYIASKLIPRT